MIFSALEMMTQAAMLAGSLSLYGVDPVPVLPPGKETVAVIEGKREWWRSESNCRWYGVMTQYYRTWEERQRQGEGEDLVLAPEPDKSAGFAAVFTRKVCDGQVTPVVLLASRQGTNRWLGTLALPAQDFTQMKPEQRPQWTQQVLERIARLAKTNEIARRALWDLKAADAEGLTEDAVALLQALGVSTAERSDEATQPTSAPNPAQAQIPPEKEAPVASDESSESAQASPS